MDHRQQFCSAAETVAGMVARVPDDVWPRPALGTWDVRALVGHTARALQTVVEYVGRPATVAEADDAVDYFVLASRVDPAAVARRGVEAGQALGPHPAEAVRALVGQARAVLEQAGGDPLIATAVGGMRLDAYLPTRTFELVVHGLDLHDATGVPADFAGEVVEATCSVAARLAARRGHGPALLRALTGRATLPDLTIL